MGIALGSITLTCVNDGEIGNGILSTVIEYCPGISPTEAPGDYLTDQNGVLLQDENGKYLVDGIWSETVPIVPPGYYLWTRTTITYDDGKQTVSYSVSKEGITIVTEERQYYLSTSYETLNGGEWEPVAPYPIPEGLYLWGRLKFTMSDGSVQYSAAIYENTISGIMNKTDENERNILMKIWETDIKSAITDYDTLDATTTIRDRISEYYQDLGEIHTTIGDTTSIDGDIISNMSLIRQTANKINWIVSSNATQANVSLTPNAFTAIVNEINLSGRVAFSSFDTATKNSFNTTASTATAANNLSNQLKNIMGTWVNDATLATTYINGGYIQTHTIEAKRLATNAIMSYGTRNQNGTYSGGYSRKGSAIYSDVGSLFDLQYGNIFTPSFSVINTVPSGESLTVGAYFNGHVTAKSLTVGTNSTLSLQQGTLQEGAAGIVMNNGSLQASNAVIYGTIYASLGKIGGWTIGTDILYYSSNTPSSTSIILKPGGVASSTSIGGSTGSNTWAFTIKDVFGVRTDGYMFTTKGKIGGFTIDASKLYNGTNSLSSTTAGVYLGTDGIRNYSGTNQYVNIIGGKITAYGAEIHGSLYSTDGTIGGLTLKDGAIYKDTNTISSTTAGIYLGTDGFRNYQSGTANVTIKNGVITANGAVISGEITATKLNLSGDNAKVPAAKVTGLAPVATSGSYSSLTDTPKLTIYMTKDGVPVGNPVEGGTGIKISSEGLLTCANAVVYGKLFSAEGKIAGWNLSTTALWKDSNTSHTTPQVCSTSMLFSTGTTSSTSVGGSGTSSKTWALTISDKFGVTTGGAMFATSATISGVLTADANSKIGPWAVTSTAIKTGNYNTSGTMYFGSDYGLSISTQFRVDVSGKLYATGADIGGKLTATDGTIGGINIKSDKIYSGSHSTYDSSSQGFYIDKNGYFGIGNSTAYLQWDTSTLSIKGNVNAIKGSTIGSNTNKFQISDGSTTTQSAMYYGKSSLGANAAGIYLGTDGIALGAKTSGMTHSPFEVGSDGILYATGAFISGELHAGANSQIGPWNITATSIYKGSNTPGTAGNNNAYFGNSGLSISDNFVVSNTGVLTAKSATISGTITAGANSKIGPWTITDTSIYKGSNTPGTAGNTNAYFGSSGLSISNNFVVSSTGVLTAKSATISGTLTSGDGSSIGSWSVTNGILQNSDASIQLAPSAIASMDIIYPGGISRPTYIKAGEGGATRIGQGAIKTEYILADAYGIQGKNVIRTSDTTGNIMIGNGPLLVIDHNNHDIWAEATSGQTTLLRYKLFDNGVRGFGVGKDTAQELITNRVYLAIFYHPSTSSYCGMYIIRGGYTNKVAIKEASGVTIQFPNDNYKNHFQWTSNGSPVCRLEMLQ